MPAHKRVQLKCQHRSFQHSSPQKTYISCIFRCFLSKTYRNNTEWIRMAIPVLISKPLNQSFDNTVYGSRLLSQNVCPLNNLNLPYMSGTHITWQWSPWSERMVHYFFIWVTLGKSIIPPPPRPKVTSWGKPLDTWMAVITFRQVFSTCNFVNTRSCVWSPLWLRNAKLHPRNRQVKLTFIFGYKLRTDLLQKLKSLRIIHLMGRSIVQTIAILARVCILATYIIPHTLTSVICTQLKYKHITLGYGVLYQTIYIFSMTVRLSLQSTISMPERIKIKLPPPKRIVHRMVTTRWTPSGEWTLDTT